MPYKEEFLKRLKEPRDCQAAKNEEIKEESVEKDPPEDSVAV